MDTTPKGIAQRIKWGKQFLEELLKEMVFKSTNEVLVFLSMSKESFEKVKKELSKSADPRVVSDIPHPNGKVFIKVVNKNVTISNNINRYCSEALALYAKLKLSNIKIAEAMTSLSLLLSNQAEIYKSLAIANLNIKVLLYIIQKCTEMAKTWNSLKSLNLNQSEYLKVQAELVRGHMRDMIKRLKRHTTLLNEVRLV